jgi:protein SCO1/2
VIGAAALALGVYSQQLFVRPPAEIPGLLWPDPKPIQPFSLDDHRGQPFDLERLKGHWTLLFFGYTNCPDVCPATLAVLSSVARRLAGTPAARDLQYVFVSVDPQRDTPDRLAQYVTHFDPGFIGVTGPQERLGPFARQLGVLYMRNEADAQGAYTMDHSASVFLTDPQGRLLALIGPPHVPEEMAERLRQIRRLTGG